MNRLTEILSYDGEVRSVTCSRTIVNERYYNMVSVRFMDGTPLSFLAPDGHINLHPSDFLYVYAIDGNVQSVINLSTQENLGATILPPPVKWKRVIKLELFGFIATAAITWTMQASSLILFLYCAAFTAIAVVKYWNGGNGNEREYSTERRTFSRGLRESSNASIR